MMEDEEELMLYVVSVIYKAYEIDEFWVWYMFSDKTKLLIFIDMILMIYINIKYSIVC